MRGVRRAERAAAPREGWAIATGGKVTIRRELIERGGSSEVGIVENGMMLEGFIRRPQLR